MTDSYRKTQTKEDLRQTASVYCVNFVDIVLECNIIYDT